jgi:uncharacterized OB-fold protein
VADGKQEGRAVEFAQFGVMNFAPFTKVAAFAAHLAEGRIMATRCKGCGHVEFPPRADCHGCGIKDEGFEWVPVSGAGTLVTYTTIHAAPTGFADRAPYTIGVIDLEEGGRLLSWVEDVPEAELRVGMRLKAHVVTLPPEAEGRPERYIYMLRRTG